MDNLEYYEWAIYSLSLLSIILLGGLLGTTAKNNFRGKAELVKKICLAVFITTLMYWIITFPFVWSYYNYSDKTDYPAEISAEKQVDYIREDHRRIISLETDLKRTKDELLAVRERISLLLTLLMNGLIFFGSKWIFYSNRNGSEENQNNLSLTL